MFSFRDDASDKQCPNKNSPPQTLTYLPPTNRRKIGQRLLSHPRALRLDQLRLSYRTRRNLQEAGVQTVGELTGWSAAGLLALPTFGQTCLAEVERMLHDFGLSLAAELPKTSPGSQSRSIPAETSQTETLWQQKRRARQAQISTLRSEGRSVCEIASRLHISRQWVYALLKQYGLNKQAILCNNLRE